MPTPFLTATVDIMAPLLTQLSNLSFTTGVFPTEYKLGHVTPLLKKPSLSKDDPANYRPITNLCAFSKILERLALKRLQWHVLASGDWNWSVVCYLFRIGYLWYWLNAGNFPLIRHSGCSYRLIPYTSIHVCGPLLQGLYLSPFIR